MTRTSLLIALCLAASWASTPAGANVDHVLRGASWIWDTGSPEGGAARTPRRLRKTFELNAPAVEGTALVSVDDNHRLFVNGRLVGAKEGWKEPGRYDLKPLLARGRNVIAVEGIDTGGSAGAIVAVSIVTQDGAERKSVSIVSDATWKVDVSAADKSEAWTKAEFDDAKWKAPVVLGDAGVGPWSILGAGKTPTAGAGAKKGPAAKAAKDVDQAPEEQQKAFTVPEGYAVELVASEPLVNNPVCMALDEQGRIYVAESHTYRYGKDKSPVPVASNPIVMLKPRADGESFERVVVAEGFDDPVMGLLIKGGRMWAAANNYLFLFDIDKDGRATNKRTILEDKGKAWNPFGMFVIKFGPDGLLYLSVGNHGIKIEGPGGQKVTSRGSSGIVCRMNPDGTNIEVLVQGFRVPYTYDMDPFGQLWLMSNGEGMPNRFAKIIDAPAIDYHGYSRTNDADWLGGRNPLAPPAFELPRGANTSMLAYYGAGFPLGMQGKLFCVNWGPHGLGVANHSIDLYEPDERRNVYQQEPPHWLTCSDAHFRPTTVLVGPDGNLLLADFYNRDDESDKTGRVWRVRYTGKDAAGAAHTLKPERWTEDAFLVDALGNPDHLKRERAVEALAAKGQDAVPILGEHAAKAQDPLGAAMALWTLARTKGPYALAAMARGAENPDWKVRRLTALLVSRYGRRYKSPAAENVATALSKDPDAAVRVAAAVGIGDAAKRRAALIDALNGPSATEAFTRYEACSHLAPIADDKTIPTLLQSENENTRLAGLILIDIACYEKADSRPAAQQALATAIANPGKLNVDLLLDLASMNRSPELVKPLGALVQHKDLPATTVAKAVVLLLTLPAGANHDLSDVAMTALTGIREGKVPVRTDADRAAVLRLLPWEGPTPFAIKQIADAAKKGGEVGRAANEVARTFNNPAPPELLAALWKLMGDAGTPVEQRAEVLLTVTLLEKEPDAARWAALLTPKPPGNAKDGKEPVIPREAVRAWRRFAGNADMTKVLVAAAPDLLNRDPALAADLAAVLRALSVPAADLAPLNLPPAPDETALRAHATGTTGGGTFLGRMVFTRGGCAQCHSPGTDTRLGPPLAGVGAQPRDYLIESMFEPSKIIKTGFDTEVVETTDGNTFSGLVKETGDALRVTTATGEDVVPKSKVQRRRVQKLSIMPEGLAKPLSAAELNDLLAYLQSLKVASPAGH